MSRILPCKCGAPSFRMTEGAYKERRGGFVFSFSQRVTIRCHDGCAGTVVASTVREAAKLWNEKQKREAHEIRGAK